MNTVTVGVTIAICSGLPKEKYGWRARARFRRASGAGTWHLYRTHQGGAPMREFILQLIGD